MHASDVHCSTSRELGLCGLDLSEPEANNSRRVIGCRKSTLHRAISSRQHGLLSKLIVIVA